MSPYQQTHKSVLTVGFIASAQIIFYTLHSILPRSIQLARRRLLKKTTIIIVAGEVMVYKIWFIKFSLKTATEHVLT
jgi:hypothetical protein